MPAVRLHALEHPARLLRHLAVDAVEDQLGVAEDGVERRAQLVAHVGEELRLVLARHSSCWPFSSISLNRRAFWIASTDWAANVCSRLDGVLGKFTRLLAADHERTDDPIGAEQRHDQQRAEAGADDDIENEAD